MFIFQSKFNKTAILRPDHRKSGTSKKIQWDFQISKVGSLDFLDLIVNGSPVSITIFGRTKEFSEVGGTSLMYNFGVHSQFWDVIYGVRPPNGSPALAVNYCLIYHTFLTLAL